MLRVPFLSPEAPLAIIAVTLLLILIFGPLKPMRRSLINTSVFFFACLLGDLLAGFLSGGITSKAAAGWLRQLAVFGEGLAVIRFAGLAFFNVALPRINLRISGILADILVIIGYIGWGFFRLNLAGVELSHLFATSAILTAVLAISMQDTLGNILGGLALQLDSSVELGDWIKVDDIVGRVVDIRWRHTALETKNGETVVMPNSLLMKSKFTVIWSPEQAMQPWRRWIWFNVDYAVPPSRVIEAVEQSVASADIANVARTPPPSCVLMEFGPSYGRYALRYWLTDPRVDDPTDSAVRAHVLAALQRTGIRIAEPEYSVHMIKENEAHREAVRERELGRRLNALRGVELFASFSEGELKSLAERLVHAPFARGDVITRQGAVAHWLYILVGGEAEVWFEQGDVRRLLTTLPSGSVFGEMGMLTGEPRRASVRAKSDVECYRLDKAGFEDILRSRPAIAEEMAAILAERNTQLESVQEALGAEAHAHERSRQHASILGKMRAFFKLG